MYIVNSIRPTFFITSYHPGVRRTTRWGPVHMTSLSKFELLCSVTTISLTDCYIKILVAFTNIIIYVFHFNLTAILCICVLTVTNWTYCYVMLLTYLLDSVCSQIEIIIIWCFFGYTGNKHLLRCDSMWKDLLNHFTNLRCIVNTKQFLPSRNRVAEQNPELLQMQKQQYDQYIGYR